MRFAVVASRFGGVLAELGGMLTAALQRAGADSALVDRTDPAIGRADRVLLLGAGIEFDGALAALEEQRSNADVSLWALDPFPPLDLPPGELERGLTSGRRLNRIRKLERRVGAPTGAPGRFGRAKVTARAAAVRLASGGRTAAPEMVFAFERLSWLTAAYRDGRVCRVLASSPESVRALGALDVQATFLPVPHDPTMGCDRRGARDLDVVFLGSSLDQRGPRLAELSHRLAARGVTLTVVDRDCFGDERTALLNRARVSVNLHKFPWHLERIRLHLSMACGAAVVSELPLTDPAPFERGRHLEAAAFDDLSALIVEVLDDDERRGRLVHEAACLVRSGPTMDSVASMLLAG